MDLDVKRLSETIRRELKPGVSERGGKTVECDYCGNKINLDV